MQKALLIFLAGLMSIAFMCNAAAEEMQKVGATELKKLITGCTVHNSCQVTGEISKTYFYPSGKLIRESQGQIVEGTYYIKDDGTHCNVLDGKHLCADIMKTGDGTYHRIAPNGKRLGIWNKVVPGNEIGK